MEIVLIIIAAYCIYLYYKHKMYKESSYHKITKNSYCSVKRDKGKYGEYLTYLSLRHFEYNGCKLLFNIYIPKGYNKTTEIDVLLISAKGIFVFECKNYSGWIFGNETNLKWTQTLPQGRARCHKEYFYNPVKQNASHIRHLKKILSKNIPVYSIIVFSDECTLKNVTVTSNDVIVTNRRNVHYFLAEKFNKTEKDIYTQDEINIIYSKLYLYTQPDTKTKMRHIEAAAQNAAEKYIL